jgi:hypothetical protein
LLLVALPDANECCIGGGVAQRRSIVAYDPQTPEMPPEQRVVVDAAFDPAPRPGQPWRIASGPARRPDAGGTDTVFVWDGTDAGGGPVFLRGTPRDDEIGTVGQASAAKRVRSLDARPVTIAGLHALDRPESVATADLDGDGDQDLVSANANGDSLTVFFQDLAGTFDASLRLGNPLTTNRPRSVAAADLEGDGDQDLVSANFAGNNLAVFLQDSPGSFASTPLTLGSFGGPYCVASADLDGDGDQDLLSANSTGDKLGVFFQDSPGSFVSTGTLGGFQVTNGPFSVAAADLDGDGDLDPVSANRVGDSLTVFFQTEAGSFASTPLTLGSSATIDGPFSVAAADLDGDGDHDLACANLVGHDLAVFLQESPGSFASAPLLLGGFPTTAGPSSVSVADLNADGDQDLASANLDGDDLTVFFQSSPGRFASNPLALEIPLGTPVSIASADLDGDGKEDLVSADLDGDVLTAFFQSSPGSFGSIPQTLGVSLGTPGYIAAADLDGDGNRDLASANFNGSDLTVFFQRAAGSYLSTPVRLGGFPTTFSPVSVAAADLDRDGDQDLVSANANGHDLTVFFQSSPGNLASAHTLRDFATNRPRCVAATDLDGDDDQDLVVADEVSLKILFQDSPGGFASPALALAGIQPTHVVPADLDQDGDQDLVSASSIGNDLTAFFQISPGEFAPAPFSIGGAPTTRGPASVAVADLDGDGDQDLVSANQAGSDLTVFFQDPAGSFPSPITLGGLATTNGPTCVATADLDGDGDLDVVSANNTGNTLTIFSQGSPGRFASTPFALGGTPATDGPLYVAAADLDGDGDEDLVSANAQSFFSIRDGNLSIFWGGR